MWDRERPHARRVELFAGRGTVRVWDLLGAAAGPARAVLACELEAGGRVGAHVQEELDEVVIVVEGAGTAWVDDAPSALSAGAVVPLRLGQTLAIENRSPDEVLRYLIVKMAPTPHSAC